MMFSGGKAPANIEFFERKNSTMKKLNKKGFTIVELVIVIAVIAILAGVLIPTFATVVDKANESKAMQEAKNEYEAYLAEYAEKLTGEESFYVVVDYSKNKYAFEVNKGQFNAAKMDKIPENITEKADQSKVYVNASEGTTQTDKFKYEEGLYIKDSNGTYVLATTGKTDLGSANVAIYAK